MMVDAELWRRLQLPGADAPADIIFVTLHEDMDGNLWLGTDNHIRPSPSAFSRT